MSHPRKLTPFQAAKMFNDIANGMSKPNVAVKYDISLRSVHRYISRGANEDEKSGPDKRPGPRLKRCGTMAAYKRHVRNKEIACDKCLRANARYVRKSVKKVKQRESTSSGVR